jgi:hypothetical protein
VIENISFHYPWWFIFGCLLLGGLYSAFMYYRESKFSEGPAWLKSTLAILRFLSVALTSFLLMGPIIKSLQEELKNPTIVFLEDISKSISIAHGATSQKQITDNLNALKNRVKEKYEVKSLYFGEDVSENKDSLNANSSNLAKGLEYVYDNYADQNIGSIIVLSDGIYNEGINPIYTNTIFKNKIHAIALGDTSIRKDLVIKNVLHNKIAYLGDKFNVKVDISALNCNGATSKLKIVANDKAILQEIPFNIESNSFFKTVELVLDASQVGIQKYTVSVQGVSGEVSSSNNKKDFYIEVLDDRLNVLILANAPHPDIAALNSLLTSNKNYKVKTAFASDGVQNLGEYSLVMLHNLPSDQNSINSELQSIKTKNIPTLFIAGSQINQTLFNQSQDVLKIKSASKNNEDIEPSLHNGFNLFTISDNLKKQLDRYPPLTATFGNYEAIPGAEVLLYQKIKKIPTKYPLLAFAEKNGVKTGVLAGEGLWKWRLTDFVDHSQYDNVTEITNKITQLLTAKDDKRKFRVNIPKNLFKENENIIFDAQLYNDVFEMINTPEVTLSIKNTSNKEYKYNFSKTNNYYTLDAGLLPEGNYTYIASTSFKGQSLSVSGKFAVQAIQLEQYDLTARHDVLRGITNKFNGTTVLPQNIEKLADVILNDTSLKPIIYHNKISKSLLHYKWIFFLLFFLLGLEWFLRRYFGSY